MNALIGIFLTAGLLIFCSKASLAESQNSRTGSYPGLYHTPLVQTSELETCAPEKQRQVLDPQKNVIAVLCQKDYSQCLFSGSCLIENTRGERIGISYYKYDEAAHQSYFQKTDLENCPYGYGYAKVSTEKAGLSCLIPYFSVSADPLEHTVGDVIYIPAIKGLKLPDGQIHDGYFIITDSSSDAIDTGYDQFNFFTGTESHRDPKNAFLKTVLSHPDSKFKYEVVTGLEADQIRAQKQFKILKTRKGQFKPKQNEMMGF